MRRADILIVGGGPAGSAAAIALARAGRAPELVERQEGPRDAVCGGFLGWDALAALDRLGLDAAGLGARPISRLRLVSDRRTVEVPLPRAAAGLSRRRLDSALLDLAERCGADVARGVSARSVTGRRVRLDDDREIETGALLLATGKHELRGAARPVSGGAVGLRTTLPGSPRLDGIVELHLFDRGYAGLLLQEDGRANFCLSVAPGRLKAAGGIDGLITELGDGLPALAERLAAGPPGEWAAVSGVPYGWFDRTSGNGVYRIGDQAAVIASLAGDGIAIALESGMAAAGAILEGRSGPDYQRTIARRAARPLRIAEAIRWAAEGRVSRRALMALAPRLAPVAARLTRFG